MLLVLCQNIEENPFLTKIWVVGSKADTVLSPFNFKLKKETKSRWPGIEPKSSDSFLKERYHGLSMILISSKTYLDRKNPTMIVLVWKASLEKW